MFNKLLLHKIWNCAKKVFEIIPAQQNVKKSQALVILKAREKLYFKTLILIFTTL